VSVLISANGKPGVSSSFPLRSAPPSTTLARHGTPTFITEKATTTFRALDAVNPAIFPKQGWWTTGNWGDTLMTSFYPVNMIRKVGLAVGTPHTYAASSLHPGGVNGLMGDGSVRFIKETVQSWPFDPLTGAPSGAARDPGGWWTGLPRPGVWQGLATRNGGETASASDP